MWVDVPIKQKISVTDTNRQDTDKPKSLLQANDTAQLPEACHIVAGLSYYLARNRPISYFTTTLCYNASNDDLHKLVHNHYSVLIIIHLASHTFAMTAAHL